MRLYAFIDRDLLHLQHRARFFRMAEIFLSSTYAFFFSPDRHVEYHRLDIAISLQICWLRLSSASRASPHQHPQQPSSWLSRLHTIFSSDILS